MGYEPTHEERFQAYKGKKRMCDTSGMSILHIRTTFPAPSKVIMPEPLKELEDEESDLARIIWLCPGEFFVNAIISLKDKYDFYYPTKDARQDDRPLDHRSLLCGCTG